VVPRGGFLSASGAALSQEIPMVKWKSISLRSEHPVECWPRNCDASKFLSEAFAFDRLYRPLITSLPNERLGRFCDNYTSSTGAFSGPTYLTWAPLAFVFVPRDGLRRVDWWHSKDKGKNGMRTYCKRSRPILGKSLENAKGKPDVDNMERPLDS
jgi:hypothetical protein